MKKLTLSIALLISVIAAIGQDPVHFVTSCAGYGYMNIYIVTATLNGVNMQPGDEIGIYDGTLLVGAAVLTQELTPGKFLSFTACEDDPGGAKDGFKVGNAYSFKVWDQSTDTETDDVTYNLYPGGDAVFASSGTAAFDLIATMTVSNTAPIVSDIPDQTIAEGSSFATINLDDFVTDAETPDASIAWTYSGNTALTVSIVDRVATIGIPGENWNGSETITFTATDNDASPLSDSDPAVFTVTAVNDLPVISGQNPISVAEDEALTIAPGDLMISDVDNDLSDLSVHVLPGVNYTVTGTASITPDLNFNGPLTVNLTVNDLTGASAPFAAAVTVTAVNDAPVVMEIPDNQTGEGMAFPTVFLSVTDVETPLENITWTCTGNNHISVVFTSSIYATLYCTDENWTGSETITFIATDDDPLNPLSDSDEATFTVIPINDAPVVEDIPDQAVAEGESFATINLDEYVADVETPDASILWSFSGNTDLTVSIVDRVATIGIPDENWNGSETITFTATDDDASPLSDSDAAVFAVTAVNDKPVPSDISNQTVAEGVAFASIDLDEYISDVETPDELITWTYSGNTDLIVTITDRVATVSVPDENWNGVETITFTATDDDPVDPQSDYDNATFTVTPVNDVPVVTGQGPLSVDEDQQLTIAMADLVVSDVDNDLSDLTVHVLAGTNYTVTGTASILPDLNFNGPLTVNLTVNDPGGASAPFAAAVTVTPVNDPPVFTSTPVLVATEGVLYTYTVTVSDVDAGDVLTVIPDVIPAWLNFDGVTKVLSGTPGNDDTGIHSVDLSLSDGTETVHQLFSIEVGGVNDAPVVSDIPDQTIAEGSTFATIDLDDFVTDAETPDASIVWTFSGNTDLTVTIVDRVATIGIPDANWNGSETITFAATDDDASPLSDSDPAVFTVTAINDAPEITDIPDQTIAEGSIFETINLDNHVSDTETPDASIVWTFSGNTDLTVSIVDRVATIGIPDLNWNGSETITFTATDDDASPLSDSDPVVFTVTAVNDLPVITGQHAISTAEDVALTIALGDLTVTDVDNPASDLTVHVLPGTNYTVTGTASITPALNFNGPLTVNLTVNDLAGASAPFAAAVTVTPVNDPPAFTSIPVLSATENVLYTYNVTVSDPDAGDALTVTPDVIPSWLGYDDGTRILSGTPGNDDTGIHSVDLSLSDGTETVHQLFSIEVGGVNDAPVVGDIPDQTIAEGSTFATIQLDDFVTDAETPDASIVWTFSGNTDLTVTIVDRVATIGIPDLNWNGSETITFTAADNDASPLTDSDPAVFTVTAVNDIPVITGQNPISVAEDQQLTIVMADLSATDVDNPASDLSVHVLAGTNYAVTGTASIIPALNYNGPLTVNLTVNDLAGASAPFAAAVTVTPVNDPPVFTSTPVTVATEGVLYTYTVTVSDPDAGDVLTVIPDVIPAWLNFDGVSRILSGTPGNDDSGIHSVDLSLGDGTATVHQLFSIDVGGVNDAPVVGDIPDQEISEGESFIPIELDNYVTDAETPDAQIVWSFSGNTGLSVSIVDRVAFFGIPGENWNGSETITFTATDNDGSPLSDSDDATFTVTAVNDAPVVSDIPSQTISEGNTFATVNLDNFVEDIETPDASIVWTFSGNADLSVTIIDRVATIGIPDENWNGSETITFTATDDDASPLSDSDPAVFTVSAVNDLPVITGQLAISTAEDVELTIAPGDLTVTDIDNPASDLTVHVLPGTNYTVTGTASITPALNFNGPLTVNLTVNDLAGASAPFAAAVTVTPVNDPPVFTSTPILVATEGVLYSYTVTVTDPDAGDILTIIPDVIPAWLNFDGVSRILSGTPGNDDTGIHSVDLSLSDGTETVHQLFSIEVGGVNDPPVVGDIPDQTIIEGESFVSFDLNEFVTDPETADGDILWTYSGNVELGVNIVHGIAIVSVPGDENWNGSETITFTATDDDPVNPLSDFDAAVFTVTAVNDPPVFTSTPVLAAQEDALYSYTVTVTDPDAGDILTVTPVTIPSWASWDAGLKLLSGTPVDGDAGDHPVDLSLRDGTVTVHQVFTITVSEVNDAPVVGDIPGQTIIEGESFVSFDLNEYVTDDETADGDILWSYSGNVELGVNIVHGIAIISVPGDENWNGSETITFTATDDDPVNPLSDFDAAVFTVTAVNDAPIVGAILDQMISEGGSFGTVNLDDFVTDVETPDESITWTYSGNTELTVSIVNRVATIMAPGENWFGSETITFTATDDDDVNPLSDFDVSVFTVIPVNDAPVVGDIPDQAINSGETFATIILDNYVSDVETPDAGITWSYSGNSELIVSITDRIATITAPPGSWSGSETITFTATDDDVIDPLTDSDDAIFSVNAVSICVDETFTAASGTITDNSGASEYQNNMSCRKLIQPADGGIITLSFTEFSTESGYDFVRVYDGATTSAPLLGTFSGSSLPASVTSSNGSMLITFITDYNVTAAGWRANYTSAMPTGCINETFTAASGTVTDNSGSMNYVNNMSCEKLIQPAGGGIITLTFTEFITESGYDFVRVYNGTSAASPLLGAFSGSALPPSLTSTGGSMFITFSTDYSYTAAGWSATYTSGTPGICVNETFTDASGTVTDNSGASNYQNNMSCEKLIQPAGGGIITLTFTEFNTEFNYDFVRVYDGATTSAPLLGRFSGSSLPAAVTSTGGSMLITFITDYSVTTAGWRASYTSGTTGGCFNETFTDASGTVTDNSGSSNYQNNMSCEKLIQPANGGTITLTFTTFSTESGYDFVRVYDGATTSAPLLRTLSGSSLPAAITSSGGSMLIRFTTDYSVTAAGWSAAYTTNTSGSCVNETFTTANGTVTDNSGSSNYQNNMSCEKLIQPAGGGIITLTFTEFRTESGYDFVRVYDGATTSAPLLGTFSGTALPASLTSSGGSMLIRFTTDYSVTYSGWSATYSTAVGGTKSTETITEQRVLPATSLIVYPNPVSGILTIVSSSSEVETYRINLISTSGQVIMNQKIEVFGGKCELDMSNVHYGPYLLQVITNNTVEYFRVIKN